ncbi:MAG: phospho-N-acetylmuramoyl-pentapeptide-transferase [Clostridia bacterium]|nr:phospho-N-acetylmuramoyl-pentapeptide-transferase [Clostridia bacterium]
MEIGKYIVALLISFVATVCIGPILIKFLTKLKFGQEILDIGPSWHKKKAGTPTMGGFMFIIGTFFGCISMGITGIISGDYEALLPLIFSICFGFVGFFDDYVKVVKKRNLGLTAKQKIILQLLVAVIFVVTLKNFGFVNTYISIPFLGTADFSWLYYPFAVFVILGTVNSVNLTDGLDGLVSMVTLPPMIFLTLASFMVGKSESAIFTLALIGGLIGFLIFNFHPAKVFMGDTGSLFLGGAVVTTAFVLDIPFFIILFGVIFFCEALSDIIQIGYFKITKGKRIFKMAPIHHHFEKCGWSENKIVFVFSSVSAIFSVISYIALKLYLN